MKTLKNTAIAAMSAIVMLLTSAFQTLQAQPGGHVSFQLFYDELAPYGEWVDDPDHGYIWLPDAGPDFRPYATNGHWVMTSYGNTWVSNYSWGWAPFHYGRWIHTDYYGWAWIPGYEWGPAWVSWRNGGGYYGWAPLGPRMGVHVNLHVHIPSFHWVFVPQRYVCSPYVYRYYTPHRNIVNIYNRTTIINNTYVYNNLTYISGPRRSDLERATRSRITVRDVHNSSRPGRASVSARSVNIYRPEVSTARGNARPARVADRSSVTVDRNSNLRNAGNSSARPDRNNRPVAGTRSTTERAIGVRSTTERATGVRSTTENSRMQRPSTDRNERTVETRSRENNQATRPSRSRTETSSRTVPPRNEAARPQASDRQQRPSPQVREQRSSQRPQSSTPVYSTSSARSTGSGSAARPARSSEPARSAARPSSETSSSRTTRSSGGERSERSSSARSERGSR